MISLPRCIFAFLLLVLPLGLAACNDNSEDAPQPHDFVAELYSHYQGKGPGAGLDYSSKDVLEEYFTADMAAAITAAAEKAAAAGEAPALAGDPFVGAQEWEVKNLKIEIEASVPGQTRADISFQSLDEVQGLTFDLVLIGGAWKIADIDWGYNRLSRIVAP